MGLLSLKKLRKDISDYVLHSTRNKDWARDRDKTFDIFKEILLDGFFVATFSKKLHTQSNLPVKTIEGDYPAVCFTEQPLEFFVESIKADHRYTEFVVAIRKDELFNYGGRPVIYNNRDTLKQLPDDLKYLWVTYDPCVHWDDPSRSGQAIDWTHEREWRARPNRRKNKEIGLYSGFSNEIIQLHMANPCFPPLERVPILLPDRQGKLNFTKPHFIILVDTKERKRELIKWINDNLGKISEKGDYWRNYAIALHFVINKTQVLSFEEVSEDALGRIEDFLERKKV